MSLGFTSEFSKEQHSAWAKSRKELERQKPAGKKQRKMLQFSNQKPDLIAKFKKKKNLTMV